ncbi:MAG: hypothetical protein ACREMF_07770 [Gemmatimonadales bacterium]
MRVALVMVTLFVPLPLLSLPAAAQTAVSMQGGFTSGEGERYVELGLRVGPEPATPIGMGLSLDLYPEFAVAGALAGVTDLSLTGNLRLARTVTLELRAGGSALIAVGAGLGAVIPGYHLGAGLVLTPSAWRKSGLRVDYTYRRLSIEGDGSPLPSLTVGILMRY